MSDSITDRQAQILLDAIHETNIFTISWELPTKKARIEQIRLLRERLRYIKRHLRQEQETISKSYDGRVSWQAIEQDKQLRPLALIDNLIARLELHLREVEAGHTDDLGFVGDIIYGSHDEGYWAIGTELEAARYNNDLLIKYTVIIREKLKLSINQEQKRHKSKNNLILAFIIMLIGVFHFVVFYPLVTRMNISPNNLIIFYGTVFFIVIVFIGFVVNHISTRKDAKKNLKTLKKDYAKHTHNLKRAFNLKKELNN